MINPINFGNNNFIEAALKKADAVEKEKKSQKELKEACQNFEAIFLDMVFKSMRNTVPKSNLMGNSFATEIYEDMLYQNFTDEAAKGGGFGLADMLYNQLSLNMENSED